MEELSVSWKKKNQKKTPLFVFLNSQDPESKMKIHSLLNSRQQNKIIVSFVAC